MSVKYLEDCTNNYFFEKEKYFYILHGQMKDFIPIQVDFLLPAKLIDIL